MNNPNENDEASPDDDGTVMDWVCTLDGPQLMRIPKTEL